MAEVSTSTSLHFAALPDPQVDRTNQHRLLDILSMALCVVLCGADDFVGMATFAAVKVPWRQTFLPLPGGIPSHDMFRSGLRLARPETFQSCSLVLGQVAVGEKSNEIALSPNFCAYSMCAVAP